MSCKYVVVDLCNFYHLICVTEFKYDHFVQLRDTLQTYNRVTELCFRRCAANFNYRELTAAEVCIFSFVPEL